MLRRNIQGLTMPNGELRVFRDKEATVATKTDTTQSSPFGAVHNVFANFDPAATWQQALAGATDRAHAWANECALIEVGCGHSEGLSPSWLARRSPPR